MAARWLWDNRQWVFSGIGIAVLPLIWKVIIALRRAKPQPASGTPNPVLNQSPVININNNIQQNSAPNPSLPPPQPPPSKSEIDPRPKFETLHPRIACIEPVNQQLSDAGDLEDESSAYRDGFTEGGNDLIGALAVVRMYRPPADDSETFITARLAYRGREETIGLYRETPLLFNVNNGTWLEERFNVVKMTLTDTRELILAIEYDGKCLAVQDNRHSVERHKDFAYPELPRHPFYVDVTLTDRRFGNLISFTYEITPNPLRVAEIIRVPKRPF